MKRSSRKKAKDKPKRPLSAYNYFFKTERQRILKYLARKTDAEAKTEDTEEEVEEVVSAEQESKLVTESGKVSFEEMGKLIGRRWKAISPESLEHYNKLAAQDAERYKKELAEYNDRKEKGAIHEAQRNAMMQMHGQGPPGERGYYPPPHYGGHSSSSMGMYGAPYNSGMGGHPYMGGPMYHGPYGGGGYPEYGGSYGSRGNPGDSSYPPPQGGPPMHPGSHHSQPGPGSSSGYSQGNHSMDPYGSGSGGPPPGDYPPPMSSGQHHPSEGPPPPSHGGYGSSSGGYPSQSYGGPPGYGQYPPSGAPQDQGGHQRW